jgi:serine/threonine protein kinase
VASDFASERYGELDRLGAGGMGIVYRALDRKHGVSVALKRLIEGKESSSGAGRVELFHQEYRTLCQLAHPHVVRVHDFGVDGTGPFYTMELLEGADLYSLAPLEWRECCALIRDICSALALLHSRRLLHRDLSPRNIKRADSGRAKLIDFGAMSPMGHARQVIGTPPFVAPEVLAGHALDARTDLYSVGATLYFALTGSHAFPAKRLRELQALWQAPPLAPSLRKQGIPADLDTLVLSLLNVDPQARPRDASEVLDRLNAIAGLCVDEQLDVRHAYLSTPELVGRSGEIAQIREHLIASSVASERRMHRALLIEGEPGVGRSRMLDATVMEAKLAGYAVVRASSANAGGYGGLSSLLSSIVELFPNTQSVHPACSDVLALAQRGELVTIDHTRRSDIYETVRSAIRLAVDKQPLLVAIDDIDRCDRQSQAAYAFLVRACAQERVAFAATALSTTPIGESVALDTLRDEARAMPLRALEPGELAQLLGSLFGDAPHLAGLCAYMIARVDGKPAECVELSQYLIDQGFVRYQRGSWALPGPQQLSSLPTSLSRARSARLDALSADARELAEALALAWRCDLESSACAELTAHGVPQRALAALHELLVANILRLDGARCVFTGEAWADELRSAPQERAQATCARIADALARRQRDRLDVADFLVRAGLPSRAIDTVLAELADKASRWDCAPRSYGSVLAACIAGCAAPAGLARRRTERIMLLREIVSVGQDLTVADLPSYFVMLFDELRKDSGLAEWDALPADMPAMERLTKALERTQQRFDAASEKDRGLAPIDAIRTLTRVATEAGGYAAQVSDIDLFNIIPSLEPLCPLSPAIERVWNLSLPACRATVAGRYREALNLYQQASERVSRAETSGLDEVSRLWSVRALHYAMGCIEAAFGCKRALHHAEQLDREKSWGISAIAVRCVYYGALGHQRELERLRRLLEMKLLESPVKPVLAAGAAHQYLFIASLAQDLTWLKQLIPELEAVASIHPTFQGFVSFARSEVARVSGDHEAALVIARDALSHIRAGQSPLWAWIQGGLLQSLLSLGRIEEVRDHALRALQDAEAVGLDVLKDHIEMPLGLAEAKLGQHESACARLDRCIASRHEQNADGTLLGLDYEHRARVALWMGDQAGFERFAERCGKHYKKSGGTPAVAARYERLIQEGRHSGLVFSAGLPATITAIGSTTRGTLIGATQTRTAMGDLGDDFDIATVIEGPSRT